jgi:hypothetical protein
MAQSLIANIYQHLLEYMKHLHFCAFIVLLSFAACKKETVAPPSSEKKILDVTFGYSSGQDASLSGSTYIDEKNKRIFIHPVSYSNTDPDVYRLAFTLSEKATIQPTSGTRVDLSSPVTLTVTAEDGSTQEYKIIRSLCQLRVTAQDGSTGIVGEGLQLPFERMVMRDATKGTLKVLLGKKVLGVNSSSYLAFTLTSPASGTNFQGIYTGSAITSVAIDWTYPQFTYPTIDSGSKISITGYDPAMKSFSGKIETLQSTTQTAVVKTTGTFVNIPLVE